MTDIKRFVCFLALIWMGIVYASPVKSLLATRTPSDETVPYASEIEWLYIDGKAYLDTGLSFTPASNFVIRLDIQFPDGWVVNGIFLGVIAGSSPYFNLNIGTSALKITTYPNKAFQFGSMDRNRHVITIDAINDEIWLDSNCQSLVNPISGYKSANHIILYNYTKRLQSVKARVYSLQIWDREDNLVKDPVPMRIGIGDEAVGCYYDRANPESGVNGNGIFEITGDYVFTLGPDVR